MYLINPHKPIPHSLGSVFYVGCQVSFTLMFWTLPRGISYVGFCFLIFGEVGWTGKGEVGLHERGAAMGLSHSLGALLVLLLFSLPIQPFVSLSWDSLVH